MIGKGRIKILSEETPERILDVNVLKKVLNTSMQYHSLNKADIMELIDYRNGNQAILRKIKEVRPEINNKLVVNHAQMITRMINGYFLGTPILYTQATADKKEDVELLNRAVAYEDKAYTDREIGDYQSICGTAYRIVYTDGMYADEVPFETRALNPLQTFVVYQNDVSEKPLLAVYYNPILDVNGLEVGTKLFCYTDFGKYTITSSSCDGYISDDAAFEFEGYDVGGVPIIEYPNNMWRIGDWELCIGLMDAINSLYSGRLDDVDQTVQSLLAFINVDIDSDRYKEMREAGIISFINNSNTQSDIKVINESLDQAGMSSIAKELEELLYAMIGIPDRNNRAGGGGDTGQAVELRDGWADLEIVARTKEFTYKRSEKQALRIILNIMNSKMKTTLSLMDIEIKFNRNKNNNLLVKTQAYMNLISTKTLDPADCLTIVDLVSDVNDFIERGKAFWEDEFAGKTKDAENEQVDNSTDSENAENTENKENIEKN